MHKLRQHLVDFLRREDGPTAVEYAVMLAFVIIVCVAAVATLGQNTSGVFAGSTLNNAAGGGT
jgi:pilus assembly protein Flp/PilA